MFFWIRVNHFMIISRSITMTNKASRGKCKINMFAFKTWLSFSAQAYCVAIADAKALFWSHEADIFNHSAVISLQNIPSLQSYTSFLQAVKICSMRDLVHFSECTVMLRLTHSHLWHFYVPWLYSCLWEFHLTYHYADMRQAGKEQNEINHFWISKHSVQQNNYQRDGFGSRETVCMLSYVLI